MELNDVKPSEIAFKEILKSSGFSVVFLVAIRNTSCILKVHHREEPTPWDPPHRECDIYTCESTAYRRLQQRGLCHRGVVPQFYGVIENIDPELYRPNLNMFLNDKLRPNAILLEYIPNLQMLHPSNYTKKRMENLISGLKEIHKALVMHMDTHPRNMMIVEGDLERAVWLDFDRAQTYHKATITEEEISWIKDEQEIMEELGPLMEADSLHGEIDKTYIYYV